MRDDDLDDFELDSNPSAIPFLPTSPSPVAATPSSFLQLDAHVHDAASTLRTTVPQPPFSNAPLGSPPISRVYGPAAFSYFPRSPPAGSLAGSWSPALTPSSPTALDDRPRVCVNVELAGCALDCSPTNLATPPSPLGVPGAYTAWTRRSSSSDLTFDEGCARTRERLGGELLLPPPFLTDDDGVADERRSFEGVLGVKSARQGEKERLRRERLYALGRSPPPPFPQSLFKALAKLVAILGPPGGPDNRVKDSYLGASRRRSASRHEEKQRRQVQRAESGLKAFDLGVKIGGEVTGRLRRRASHRVERIAEPPELQKPVSILDGKDGLTPRLQQDVARATSSSRSSTSDNLAGSSSPHPTSTYSTRLFRLALWIWIGSTEDLEPGRPLVTPGGFSGTLIHLVGFTFFVLSHSASLLAASVSPGRNFVIFLYWMILNLCGRTEISKAAVAYWKTCRSEWDRVCNEEEGGIGLSTWSTARGLFELAALHSMTRQRWLQEELNLIGRHGFSADPPTRRFSSITTKDVTDRPSFTMHRSSFRWNRAEEGKETDGLVVTSHEGFLLEGTLISSADEEHAAVSKSITLSPSTLESVEEPFDGHRPSSASRSLRDPQSLERFVSLLKRCIRLSTAAYGLQTYIVSPPTPLLTPSGKTLPHRLFAHLGGIKDHRHVLHVALQQAYSGSAEVDTVYAPTFYLLRDDVRRLVIVVFRGTQSLADIKTDLEGEFVPLSLPTQTLDCDCEAQSSTEYRIHVGILAAARHLLDPNDSPLFGKLVAALVETGYDLLLTGHSLGSALASTIALLVGEYDSAHQRWQTSSGSGLPPQRSVQAISFAHPTTLNVPLAARCALGTPPLVISVSLASDVITRAGLPQLRELRRALGRLDRARRGDGNILRDWRKWRSLSHGGTAQSERSKDEGKAALDLLEETAWMRRRAAEYSVAGVPRAELTTPAGKTYHLDQLPPKLEAEQRARLRREADWNDTAEDEMVLGLYEVVDPTSFYRAPLLSSDLIRSHLPKEYLDAVETL